MSRSCIEGRDPAAAWRGVAPGSWDRWGRPVDREDDLGPGPDHNGHGCPEGVKVPLLEMLTKKLIRDEKFDACVVGLEDPEGSDPRVQHLGGQLPLEGTEKPIVHIVAHGGAFLRERVTHTLIHGGG